ncbi:hypothetical protein ACFRAE_17505 [Sphingobacterium sp. HJSM2_6]|uniref:hypothetical protein n=1 Tax=Sphingobacterium sp. HJSM2_6 TaxID=3366264 RepID=UPI003BE93FD8
MKKLKMRNRNFILFSLISILFFVVFGSCSKKDDSNVVNEIITPIPLTTSAYSGLTDRTVVLHGKIGALNQEEILDYGFAWYSVDVDNITSSESYITLGAKAPEGDISSTLSSTKNFQIGNVYQYYIYVRTKNNFYKGNVNSFSVQDISVYELSAIKSYGRDTIVLQGDFSNFDQNYRLQVTGAFNIFSLPYQLDTDKKKMTFILTGNPAVQHKSSVQVSIVKKGIKQLNFERNIVTVQYFAQFEAPEKKYYKPSTQIRINQINKQYVASVLDRGYAVVNILINDKSYPYDGNFQLYYQNEIGGTSFKVGIDNGKEKVIFRDPLELTPISSLEMKNIFPRIHPWGLVRIFASNLFDFYDVAYISLAGSVYESPGNYNSQQLGFFVSDVPEGEYEMEVTDRFYTSKVKDKLKVEKLRWTAVNKRSAFVGEEIEFTGNFIAGISYTVFDENGNSLGLGEVSTNNTLKTVVNNWYTDVKGLKIGYNKDPWSYDISDQTISFTCEGFTFDKFYPSQGRSGEVLTIEGKGIAFAESFLLGDVALHPFVINNNKVTFSLPYLPNNGKVRISYYMNKKFYQSTDLFEIL